MARGTTENAVDPTETSGAPNAAPPVEAPKTRASRKGIKRGPSTVFVKYEVLDGSGNVTSGYTVRPVSVSRDAKAMVAMVLNHTVDGNYMQLSIPNSTDAPTAE